MYYIEPEPTDGSPNPPAEEKPKQPDTYEKPVPSPDYP